MFTTKCDQPYPGERTAQLEVGTVPLSDVPLMAMEVRPVSPLTSGKLPVSGVLLMVMLRRLVGGAANAVKPAPFTYSDCRAGSAGSVPVNAPTLRSAKLVSAGKLHDDGAVTDFSPLSDKLCSAGSDETASSAPVKHDVTRVQSMRNDVSDVQLAMPDGKPPTVLVLPTVAGS